MERNKTVHVDHNQLDPLPQPVRPLTIHNTNIVDLWLHRLSVTLKPAKLLVYMILNCKGSNWLGQHSTVLFLFHFLTGLSNVAGCPI